MADNKIPLSLTKAVFQCFEVCDLPASLTIEQCASDLAMSTTSFRRKLAQEESSFKLIQNKFLNELCVTALLTSNTKIDDLAIKLGYSERATFERAFRKKFGITPSQFRELSMQRTTQSAYQKLTNVVENMPPIPKSCQQLLKERDHDTLDLNRVVAIISQDLIFSGRIMGQASKAIYGRTPKTLNEAVGRNIGINNIVTFAIVYAYQDALQEHVDVAILEQYSPALLLAPRLFQLVRKQLEQRISFDIGLTEQVLAFSLLGIFLLTHKSTYKHELMLHALQGIYDLESLNVYTKESMGISLLSASTLMLSLWHIDANVIKQLTHLDKISRANYKRNEHDEIILFILSCLYFSANGSDEFNFLEDKAALLGLQDFEDIKKLLLMSN